MYDIRTTEMETRKLRRGNQARSEIQLLGHIQVSMKLWERRR